MNKIVTGGVAAAFAVVLIGGVAVASDGTNTSGVGNYPVTQAVTSQSNDYPAGVAK